MSCTADPAAATRDDLRQPSGLWLEPSGRWLYVTNGNWDLSASGGAMVVLDVAALQRAVDNAGSRPGMSGRPCWREAQAAVTTCTARDFVLADAGVALGSGVGNIAASSPAGPAGPTQLLAVQREPAAVVWLDLPQTGTDPSLDCGQGIDGHCDGTHTLTASVDGRDIALPGDPARVVIDAYGGRSAFVPHLLGGALTLIALDGEFGPEIVDVQQEFFRADPFDATEFAGGFGVAARPCDPAAPPSASRDCTRPFLYATNRFFPALRRFTVATGLHVVLPGEFSSIPGLNPESVVSQPFLGDLVFDPNDAQDRLLVVQTTPPGLLRVDTGLDGDGSPKDRILATVPLCENPNLVAVYRPADDVSLAVVSCYDDDRVAVIDLGAFRLLRLIDVGQGPNEIFIDAQRGWAWIANTKSSSLSVIALNRGRRDFLTETIRVIGDGGS